MPLTLRRLVAALSIGLVFVAACREGGVTGPDRIPAGSGRLSVVANFGLNTATNLVIEVSAPDIPEPLVFNLEIVNGTASGSVTIPAGANRLITVRAFDGRTETHRGTRTVTIVEGVNPALSLTLLPLAGTVPVTVDFGVAVVTVTPLVWTNRVDDTVRFSATVMDGTGAMQVNPVIRWASTDTRRLTIDSTGLALSRDTGAVMVVAVAGGAAGRANVAITPADSLVPPSFTRTWVGGAAGGQTSWAIANNWSPAAVPTETDSVVIGAAAFQPALPATDTFRVRDLTLLPGANLQLNGRVLTVVGGTLAGQGGGINQSFLGVLRLTGGARLRGVVPAPIQVQGGTVVSLADSARVPSLEVLGTSSVFDLAGRKLVLTSTGTALNVHTGGVLRMNDPADTADVTGNIHLQATAGTQAGNLTAGTMIVRGNILDGNRYEASGTHRTVFAGVVAAIGTQTVNGFDVNARPANALQDVIVSGTSAWSVCSNRLRVRGAFTVVSPVVIGACTNYTMDLDGPLTTTVGSTLATYAVVLGHSSGTSGVLGAVTSEFLTFTAVNPQVRAGLAYRALGFTRAVSITDSIRTTGTVTVDGVSALLDVATPAGRAATFAALTVGNGAGLSMTDPTDSLIVAGTFNATNSVDLSPTLTAGTLRIGGILNVSTFGTSGSHLTVLDGASTTAFQDINQMDANARPTNRFRNLTVANTGLGVRSCFSNVRITGAFRVTGASSYSTCTGNFTRVDSLLATDAASAVTAHGFSLYNANGTQDVLGSWTPEFTDLAMPNQPVRPGLGYRQLRFFASNTLPPGATASVGILVDGATVQLTLSDGRVATGAFTTQNGARLAMDAGDTLRVTGTATFSGGMSTPSGGVLEIESTLNGTGYAPTGTHELRLRGAGVHTLNSFSDRPIPTVRVVSGSALVNFMNLVVQDSLLLAPGTSMTTATTNFVTIRGRLQTGSGSTMTPHGVVLEGTATLQLVDGSFAPAILRVAGPGTGPGTVLRNAANIAYTHVEFYTSYTLSDSLRVGGYVYGSGAGVVLDFNGRKIRAPGGLNFDNNATGRMVNAADSLIVGDGTSGVNSLLWDSGTNGTVSAGTILVRGGNLTMTNFAATGTNRVVFSDSGFALAARTSTISGGTFRRLYVRGLAQYTVMPNFTTVVVTDSLRVEAGTFQLNNSTVTVDGGGQAVLAMGSGAVLSSIGTGTLNLGSAVGTSLVSAGATFAPTLTRFLATNPAVNPALPYQNVEFYGAVTFSGNTTFSGYVSAQNTGAGVTLGGHRITVGGYFDFNTNAYLVMTDPADTLDVVGDLYVDGGVNSTLTAGVVLFRGGTLAGSHYNATAPHRTVFLGSTGTPQVVNGNTAFGRLEVGGGRGFNANGSTYTVADSLIVSAAVPLVGTGTVVVSGPMVASAPIGISIGNLRLRHASGTANLQPGTTFSAGTLFMSEAAGVPMTLRPGLAYNGLAIEAPVTLTGNVSVAGNLAVGNGLNPSLTLAGNTITVAGQVDVLNAGRLVMNTAADLLRTTGTAYIYFQGSAGTGDLSNGTIEHTGDFYYAYSPGHTATGTHRVLLTRPDARTQVVQQNSSTPIANLEIGGTGARTVSFHAPQVITGSFRVTSPAVITVTQNTTHALDVNGVMAAPATTTWSLPGTLRVNAAAGLDSLLGPVSLGGLSIGGAALNQTIPTAARYTIGNLTVLGGASARVGAGTRLIGSGTTGTLTVFGTLFIPDGSTLQACRADNGGLAGGTPGQIRNEQSGGAPLLLRMPGPIGSTTFGANGGTTSGINVQFNVTAGC